MTGHWKKYPMADALQLAYQAGEGDDETLEVYPAIYEVWRWYCHVSKEAKTTIA